jgi:hypothetical protein
MLGLGESCCCEGVLFLVLVLVGGAGDGNAFFRVEALVCGGDVQRVMSSSLKMLQGFFALAGWKSLNLACLF